MRRAPDSVGTGKWKVLQGEGDLVREVFIRDAPAGDVKALEDRAFRKVEQEML